MTPAEYLKRLIRERPNLAVCEQDMRAAFAALRGCFAAGGKLLLCGNGGSAADCEHIAGELMKGFLLKRPVRGLEHKPEVADLVPLLQGALPAVSLAGHPALATAYLNDIDPCMVFAQQVYGYGKPGDVLLGLSTSGGAQNVCRALRVANALGLVTIGLTGAAGGRMKELCNVCLRVPADETYRVQELHLPVYHTLCAMLEAEFFEE